MDYKTERQLRAELAVAWMLVDQYKIALARNCEWQPIETAPELKAVLVKWDGGRRICTAAKCEGRWLAQIDISPAPLIWPTNWMPMPDPQVSASDAKTDA